jgi:hypothetical protein
MWDTDTLWFDVAVVMSIFAVGNILFGHFEEHRPKGRRLLKVAVVLPVLLGVSATLGRPWAFGLIGLMLAGAAYIHAWWLPRRGVNGFTAEPRARYYELIGHREDVG